MQDESFIVAADASLWIRITLWGLAAERVKIQLGAQQVAAAGSVRTDANKHARYIMLKLSVAALQGAAQSCGGGEHGDDHDGECETVVNESTLAAAAAEENYGAPEASAWLVSLQRIHMPLVMDVAVAGDENVRVSALPFSLNHIASGPIVCMSFPSVMQLIDCTFFLWIFVVNPIVQYSVVVAHVSRSLTVFFVCATVARRRTYALHGGQSCEGTFEVMKDHVCLSVFWRYATCHSVP